MLGAKVGPFVTLTHLRNQVPCRGCRVRKSTS
ncbi:hypothetical protein [Bacteriophage sp.]|nr:hypothetical protein [Bacteriophage sp.]UOF80109.1 hypothetical protein [Bacteriophage sp.]